MEYFCGAAVFWLVCGLIADYLYHNRGGTTTVGFLIGLLLGPFGIILALVIPVDEAPIETRREVEETPEIEEEPEAEEAESGPDVKTIEVEVVRPKAEGEQHGHQNFTIDITLPASREKAQREKAPRPSKRQASSAPRYRLPQHIICPKCGASNPTNGMYCQSCGESLRTAGVKRVAEETIIPEALDYRTCLKCLHSNPRNAVTCEECGEAL